jgi:hypothetical protein
MSSDTFSGWRCVRWKNNPRGIFMRFPTTPAAFILGALVAQTSFGATFCATSASQLQAELTLAAGNDENDEIRVRIGTYDVSNVDLVYDPPPSANADLVISGGWASFFENLCGVQLTNPWQTVLDGNDQGRILRMAVDDGQADIDVSQLVFMNGHVDPGGGAGLSITYGLDATGTVTVERNVFLLNTADQSSALSMQGGSLQKVTNNLFLSNQGGTRAVAYLTTTGLFGVSFTNNTVLSNTHTNTNQPTLSIAAGRAFLANNNFWDNDGYDASLGSNGDRYAYNNNYEVLQLHGGEILDDNLSVEPEYEGGLFNYTPVRSSPLVDGGREPGGSPLWYLTDIDLNASARLVGPHVDIGAFENDTIFADGFDPGGPFGRALE